MICNDDDDSGKRCVTTTSNKRAKFAQGFDDMPDVVLLKVTSYLNSNSAVLFAVALTASSATWRRSNWNIKPSEASRIILGDDPTHFKYKCNFYFEFGDDEKELTAKLTDADIGGYLACATVSGQFNDYAISSISLRHCNIVGHGLEPLRGSDQITSIDLRFTLDNNDADVENNLSEELVIPILESIIEKREKPLYFTLPKKWIKDQSQLVVGFLEKYNSLMNSRNIICQGYKCENSCQGTEEKPWVNFSGDDIGTHNFTCDRCEDTFCGDCADLHEEPCVKCKMHGCEDCDFSLKCVICNEISHHECTAIATCEDCEEATCDKCCFVPYCEGCDKSRCMSCVRHLWCDAEKCYGFNCEDCADDHEDEEYYSWVKYCDQCEKSFCATHLAVEHIQRGEDSFCSNCNERAAAELVRSNKKFEGWLQGMENKYSGGRTGNMLLSDTSGSFSQHAHEREMLRKRYLAIRNLLSFKQRQFERFDWLAKQYDTTGIVFGDVYKNNYKL